MERNLWAEPMLLKRCILRSRRRVGWCEFSARLFWRKPCSWRRQKTDLRFWRRHRSAALSVTITLGRVTLLLQEFAQERHGCGLVAPPLHEQVQHLALAIDGAPEKEALATR